MTDEKLSDGEVKRRIEAVEKLAGTFVTKEVFELENRHLRKEIAEGDKDCKERTDGVRKELNKELNQLKSAKKIAWDRVAQWSAVAVALVAAVYTAYAATRGK